MVSILGGNRYSNVLYGRDAKGQLIMLNTKKEYYTLMSNKLLNGIKLKDGFVNAKSYNRTKLLYETSNNEFRIRNDYYSSTLLVTGTRF